MKPRKGFVFGIRQLSLSLLGVVFLGFVALMIFNTSTGLPGTGLFQCEENPPQWKYWCFTPSHFSVQHEAAINSLDALKCASNSVFLNHEWNPSECPYGEPAGITGGVTGLEPEKTFVKCEDDFSECVVNNFRLPQEVSDANKWIKGYGDPLFIAYWQNFPPGEDSSWNSRWNWLEDVTDLVFVWWGAGKTFKLGEKMFGYSAKKVAKGTAEAVSLFRRKVATETAEEYFIRMLKNEGAKSATYLAAEKTGKDIMKFMAKEDVERMVKRAGVAAPIALYAAYLDSKTKKDLPYKDNFLLKSPYEKPKPFKLELDENPVFLKNREVQFYLASPCEANLKVKKYVAECDIYYYNFKDDSVGCKLKNLDNFIPDSEVKEPVCNKNIEEFFPDKNNFVPTHVAAVDTKEEMRIYDKDRNEIFDPVTGLSFRFENDRLAEFTYRIENGNLITISVNEDGNFDNNDIKGDFDMHECTHDSHLECKIRIDSFDVENTDCEYCTGLGAILNNIKGSFFDDVLGTEIGGKLTFSEKTEEINVEAGEDEKDVTFDELGVFYEEGNYWYVLRDMQPYNDIDGYADYIAVDKMDWSGFKLGLHKGPPEDFIMNDVDLDGKIDLISINHGFDQDENCNTIALAVDVDRTGDTSPNFCYAESGTVRKVFRWAPEISAAIGGVIGAFGGGIGVVPAASAGYKIGAAVFTVYVVGEKITGSRAIWPGR